MQWRALAAAFCCAAPLVLLAVRAQELDHVLKTEVCEYGSLPGYWMPKENSLGTWTLLSNRCQIQDILGQHLEWALKNATTAPLRHGSGILLFGDSNDRNAVYEPCSRVNKKVEPFTTVIQGHGNETCNKPSDFIPEYKGSLNCNTCELPGLRISKDSVWSVGTDAELPFPQGRHGSAQERIDAALALFETESGRMPDVVVFSSNFWDIMRMRLHNASALWEGTFHEQMLRWVADAEADILHLKMRGRQHGFVVAMKTAHHPALGNCATGGEHAHADVGHLVHVAMLNSAAREVARRHGVHLVDVEMMLQKFWSPWIYLGDALHVGKEVNFQLLNIYLNLLRNPRPAHRPAHVTTQKRALGHAGRR